MTVENIWYDLIQRRAHNKEDKGVNFKYEYDTEDLTFKSIFHSSSYLGFQECAMITCEAVFDMTQYNKERGDNYEQSVKYS